MPQRKVITTPSDLRIPDRTKMAEVMGALTDDGLREFVDELMGALGHAEETNDLSSVQYVVDAWWVSRLFCTHPNFERALEAASWPGSAPRLTAEQVGELLGVA